MNVTLFVSALGNGGTERQVTLLALGLQELGIAVQVISLQDTGLYREQLTQAGVPYFSPAIQSILHLPKALLQIAKQLRKQKTTHLYSFLPVANLFTLLLKPFFLHTYFIWGKRSSDFSARENVHEYHLYTRLAYTFEKKCAYLPNAMIFNSEKSRQDALSSGFQLKHHDVIVNGIDTTHFCVNKESGKQFRIKWQIPENVRLIGMVSRLDPVKNYHLFLDTAAQIRMAHPDTYFVIVGGRYPVYEKTLREYANTLGLSEHLIFTGDTPDPKAAYNALDCFLFTSSTESFPNVLCEALSCGVKVVTTDVGDAKDIIAPFFTPTAANKDALSQAVLDVLERMIAPETLHASIDSRFSISAMIQHTLQVLEELKN